ncbi:hypothetical protein ABOM_000182 [Aspergillus bombycis]|uniref:Translation initiation factor 5A C-terminal domain-containing protein n=1 Tax=Aspergillus bombycis TaxID=109264 RepID=A0A1F8AHW9_9EURO|nr:hypothetical protein ABOM_000182 [Aspergillus bombycis]OGM51297.1 hypothetical protein ABOM_000182 [Aspergillus bombycis]
MFVVINGRPCKIVDISIDASQFLTYVKGLDIFTGRELELESGSGDFVHVPNVLQHVYSLVNVDEGFLNLMDIEGNPKDNVKVPPGDLGSQIVNDFNDGKELLITVLSAMGEEAAVACREAPKGT